MNYSKSLSQRRFNYLKKLYFKSLFNNNFHGTNFNNNFSGSLIVTVTDTSTVP